MLTCFLTLTSVCAVDDTSQASADRSTVSSDSGATDTDTTSLGSSFNTDEQIETLQNQLVTP